MPGVLILVLAAFGAQDPEAFTGKWKGSLTNHPPRAGAKHPDVTMEFGPMPGKDGVCTAWRTSYFDGEKLLQTKDYQLCRGVDGAWFVDEGGGVKLAARWIGGVLVSPFKYDKLLLISSVRLRGPDELEEEILTVDDRPGEKGILPLHARGLQRISLKRVR
jgi:hypothetical protein